MTDGKGLVVPTRVIDLDAARRRHGDRVDALLPWLHVGDRLADDVVASLAATPELRRVFDRVLCTGRQRGESLDPSLERFFDHIETIPDWVDRDRLGRAGRLFFRSGLLGGIVLGAKSLCYGYCSPAGNKPLVMTGRLDSQAIGKRLAETGRFVVETCRPGGLDRFGSGFVITVRVRLMHAAVRRLLRQSPRWRTEDWGTPINQHDMVATSLLFSYTFVEGIRQCGFRVTPTEVEDFLHLWRYASFLMGTSDELLPKSEVDAAELADLILMTQDRPDADSRRLVEALIQSPQRVARTPTDRKRARLQVAAGYGFCRALLGPELADELGLPRTPWRFAIPTIRLGVGAFEPFRRLSARLDTAYEQAGARYWQGSIQAGLAGARAVFSPPERLIG